MITRAATRRRLLSAGERLIAEYGVTAVSARRIAEEADAGNHSAVAYHFGTKQELIVEVVRNHRTEIDRIGADMAKKASESDDPREHLACVLLPTIIYLAKLEPPTYYARFVSQVLSDPSSDQHILPELVGPYTGPAMLAIKRLTTHIPAGIMKSRWRLVRPLMFQASASFEIRVAEGHSPRDDWDFMGRFVLDAVGGLLFAPSTMRAEELARFDLSDA
ncbi:helix-turn-helix transcriptional regulator [Microtetraspora sp. AC03309]|uniref:TetR/AcrR family transcriptional regulator n=1 Tax=Microtetraspora sp. AC03309 TaxID=2779376 RepID=UPI001E5A8075|nr:TetR/AcrR family transcriptional regulator [Microtetraspora sp. AC03309]MCC5577513.1 helix-turn-helix transcriptional regulator [Microtetraspora sp. AC03309]